MHEPCTVWGMVYTDDGCVVLRSLQGLEPVMATLVNVFGV